MSKTIPTNYYEEAKKLLFSNPTLPELLGEKHQFRKGKGIQDITKAIRLAKKQGLAKTEFEIEMLEVHLRKILKPTKPEK